MTIGVRSTVNRVLPGRRVSPELSSALFRGKYLFRPLIAVEVDYSRTNPNALARVTLERGSYWTGQTAKYDGLDPDVQLFPDDPALFQNGAKLEAEAAMPETIERAQTVEAIARVIKVAAAAVLIGSLLTNSAHTQS